MHKNPLWQAFLIVVLLATLGYSSIALYRYYRYSTLTNQISPISLNWEVKKHSEEQFTIVGNYRFDIDSTPYYNSTELDIQPYRNQWGAEQAINELSKMPWQIWFETNNPKHSSLQKNFPFKESISAIFLWLLLIYFLWLGYYVAKYRS